MRPLVQCHEAGANAMTSTYNSKRGPRSPRKSYRQWLRLQRAMREATLPVDVYLQRRDQPMGFEAYAEHYALQQWLRGRKPAQF